MKEETGNTFFEKLERRFAETTDWDRCKHLARKGSILDVLEDELRGQGFAGSADVPKLVFLSLYTRFFEKPVSLVIKGPSGSGKSYALRCGLQFVPSTAFEEFSGMSEKALIYKSDLNLKHRYLVIGEAAGLSEGTGRAFLRQLLSEGKVRYATVQKTKDGMVGQELPPLEGPTGLIMTTTANTLHPEDESRMLSYHLDESPERIREALIGQATGFRSERRALDTEPWYALHEFVGRGSLSVDIPYARSLAEKLPLSHFRVQRDFPQVLSLIRAHALMHQFTRDRADGGKVVVANLDDYRAIHDLIADPLAQGLEEAVPKHIRALVEEVKKLQGSTQPTASWDVVSVSQTQLSDALGRDQSVISRSVRKAVGQGYLRDMTPGQGRKATLVLGDRDLPAGAVLPAPEDLVAAQ